MFSKRSLININYLGKGNRINEAKGIPKRQKRKNKQMKNL
jgi:hypothetical protein